MRIAAIGRTRMLVDTVRRLAESGHSIPLIVTCGASPKHTATVEDFRSLAREVGATFLAAENINAPDVVARLRAAAADVAVSVDWPRLIRGEACTSFPHGILNAHGGDLPRYRGNAPVAWAMLMGETSIGLTIHRMDPSDFDSGPVAIKEYYPITPRTYIREVFDFVESAVPRLFGAAIDGLSDGSLSFVPQSACPSDILRCFPRLSCDAELDWQRSADYLATLVRVSAEPFDGAFTYFHGVPLRVWRARVGAWPVPSLAVPGHVVRRHAETGEVDVATGAGVLTLEEIALGADARCPPAAVIRGIRARLGSIGDAPA